jgi:LmbE family N-acetylglucosaminyl deacetylase
MTHDAGASFTRSRRILVVAPHPDDESLACGGLISLAARNGVAFSVIFVTDGGASHSNSKIWPRARLAAQREQEACRALTCLGVGDAPRLFLRLPDANMPAPHVPAWRDAVESVRDVLMGFTPDLLILPWRRDPHCDHQASWLLARHALEETALQPEILEYAIWLDELGEAGDHPRCGEMELLHVDVGAVLPQKRAAIAAHVSQTTALIQDDPNGFRLTPQTIARLTQLTEAYLRPRR